MVQLDAIERLLSRQRLTRYTNMSSGDRQLAIKLYENNSALSEALYIPLQGLEVCIRNSCTIQLNEFLDENWYKNWHGLFQHPLTEMLEKVTRSLNNDSRAITVGTVVSELNLGFWVALLAPRYDSTLWRKALRNAFPFRPKGTERREIHGSLNALRRLRNRVAHHEPILHRNLQRDYELIELVLSWTCPHTAAWVMGQSRFPSVLAGD